MDEQLPDIIIDGLNADPEMCGRICGTRQRKMPERIRIWHLTARLTAWPKNTHCGDIGAG